MRKHWPYYLTTGLVTLIALGGASQYLTMNDRIVAAFSYEMTGEHNAIGFPAWLIIPMGISKVMGAIALWAPFVPKWLREWAYAGFFLTLCSHSEHTLSTPSTLKMAMPLECSCQ